MPSRDDDISGQYDVVVFGAGPAGEAAGEPGVSLPSHASRI
jgi:pyruvate/2-oxoglutarate dehydrogenase complex dihydrolipoamide dehydrogenase (E3) component